MAKTVRLKNTTIVDKTWIGIGIAAGVYYDVPATELSQWLTNEKVFSDIADGTLIVNTGADIVDDLPIGQKAWDYISEELQLPMSDIEGKSLAVHPSYKPRIDDGITYAVWTGAGDDLVSIPNVIGDGELLHFNPTPGNPIETKDIKFSTDFGRVWIHEAYLKFTNGGEGDYLTADVMATATPVQTAANLDLVLDGDWVQYAPGGPGTGTHGWGGSPTLIPRTFSNDGDWDYDGVSLTPNFSRTGGYRINITDTSVHRYVNKIPIYGNCPYFSMSSDETAELLPGYFLRVKCHNVSDTVWHVSVIMEIYRERTVDP